MLSSPPFLKIWLEVQPPLPQQKGKVHTMSLQQRCSCKTKLSYLQHFASCLRRLSNLATYVTNVCYNLATYVTATCVTKFKPEFQNCKARKCNTFYQRKRVKGQCFWKTSFWLYKLVIRTHFKYQIQYVTFVTCEICLISTRHQHLRNHPFLYFWVLINTQVSF